MLAKLRYFFQPHRARGISVARGRVLARRFAIGSVILSLFVYWLHPVIFERIDVRLRDITFQIREAPPPPPEVAIVTIDEKSVKKFGRWPWNRELQGLLISQLKQMGAGVIALDIVYPYLQNPEQDRALAGGLASPGAPVIGGYFFRDEQSLKISEKAIREVEKSKVSMIFEEPDARRDTVSQFPFIESNHPNIGPFFTDVGFFNSIPDADGLIRSAPLILRNNNSFYPSLPLQALSYGLGEEILLELNREGVTSIRLGDIAIPVNSGGMLALNFYDHEAGITMYSASDVLEGKLQSEAIQGKLIFVGVTELGIADLRTTPVDNSFPGVAIHATVAANILQGFYLYHDNRTILINIAFILLFPLSMLWVMSKINRPLMMTGVFTATAVIAWIIFYQIISKLGFLISLFYPMASLLIGYVIFVSYGIFISDAKTRYMRRALSSYISPKFVNQLLLNPDSLVLQGEKREISVLFSDIRGFTTISEGMEPEQLVLLLNDYLGPMTEIIMHNSGTLDKYIGDAVMALYNAPLDILYHADCAAESAILMQKSLQELNEIFLNVYNRKIKIGIGIHSGFAVVGNMGSSRRFNYTAMGDTVNIASRLEGRTKYYKVDIIISKGTHDQLSNRYLRRQLDRIKVKGKNLPVDIYQLFIDSEDQKSKILKYGFESALQLYFAGDFKTALAEFQKLNNSFPDDYPTQLYMERCKQSIENPPEGEWDGVYTMTEK